MPLAAAARQAGKCIMVHYAGSRTATAKKDHSPLTEADIAAHHAILESLTRDVPHIPIISEEDAAMATPDAQGTFFLVDPLDGTLSFVRGDGEFTVNIGLIEQSRATFGVLYAPVSRVLYYGGAGIGAFRWPDGGEPEPISARVIPPEGAIITRSRSKAAAQANAFLSNLNVQEIRPSSSAIKFCWVAEGSADIYPRFGRTMEWDTAAGQAIVEAAGGSVTNIDGTPFTYAKPGFGNPGFIVRGKAG